MPRQDDEKFSNRMDTAAKARAEGITLRSTSVAGFDSASARVTVQFADQSCVLRVCLEFFVVIESPGL